LFLYLVFKSTAFIKTALIAQGQAPQNPTPIILFTIASEKRKKKDAK